MSDSLDAIEQKLDHLLAAMQRLRSENASLQLRVAALETEKSILAGKIGAARERLAALRDRLPET
jgi:uncharacterized protein (TIGR02449 family)